MPWTDHIVFFLDFEGSRTSGVLEYGVAALKEGRIVGTRTRLCGATGRIPTEDSDIHGLREDMVASEAPFSADWEYFADLRERGPFAAHYAGVENALIKAVWPYPRPSPDFARRGRTIVEWGPWIDSARLCGQFCPQIGSGSLKAVVAARELQDSLDTIAVAHCPDGRRHYHAALYDALAGALVLASLAREPPCARLSLGRLMALSTLDAAKREKLTQEELW